MGDEGPAPAAERLRAPGMLLIGSASRKAGKTELACRILRRFAARLPLQGVKVTVAHAEPGSGCPRGGQGCGACDSFDGSFCLSDEGGGPPGKDTTRMARAGARRVLWLRVRRGELRAGFEALAAELGPGALTVVESNTLRGAVDPDLFLMGWREGEAAVKETAAAVAGFADRRVRFDGAGFDLDLAALDIVDGRWRLDEPATGIVLAGGHSRRMGADKRGLLVGGVPMLERVVQQIRPHVGEIIVGADDLGAEVPGAAGLRVVADRTPGQGPLMGLASCLAASASDRNLVAACDLPEIPAALVGRMLALGLSSEGVVPRGAGGLIEPLLAVYRRRLLGDAERLLAAGERRIRLLYEGRDIRFLDLAELGIRSIVNLNTPEEVKAYSRRGRGAGEGEPL